MRFPILLLLACSGCTVVGTTFEKSVTIKKDGAGNVIERIEVERMIQPGQTEAMRMQYLDPKSGEPVPRGQEPASPARR